MVGGNLEKLPPELRVQLCGMPAIAIAFSGGLDSRFLAHAASLCGCEILLLHAAGPHVPDQDSSYARAWAAKCALRLVEFGLDPLELPQAQAGDSQRCYFCKRAMFLAAQERLSQMQAGRFVLCDGMNGDDLHAFRPGNRAAWELGIISPLASAGLSKREIRALAAATGLENPEQKARPCLLTRFDYGMRPDKNALAALEFAEAEIENFLREHGLADINFRLRLEPAPALHINRIPANLAARALKIAEKAGFQNCALRFSEEISGFFDAAKNHSEGSSGMPCQRSQKGWGIFN